MAEESKLQSKIIKFLKKEGWLVMKVISASPNAMPDIFASNKESTLWVEVKASNGKLSPLQAYRHREIFEKTANNVLVPYSYEEFLEKYYSSFKK